MQECICGYLRTDESACISVSAFTWLQNCAVRVACVCASPRTRSLLCSQVTVQNNTDTFVLELIYELKPSHYVLSKILNLFSLVPDSVLGRTLNRFSFVAANVICGKRPQVDCLILLLGPKYYAKGLTDLNKFIAMSKI